MGKFSRRHVVRTVSSGHSLPKEIDESDESDEEPDIPPEVASSLGISPAAMKAGEGTDWSTLIRGLISFLSHVRSKIRGSRDADYYEIGLRSAHAAEALRAGERDRAAAHIRQIAVAAKRRGLSPKGKYSPELVRGLAQTDRDRTWVDLGYRMSLFEESIAQMKLEPAEALIEEIVAGAAKL